MKQSHAIYFYKIIVRANQITKFGVLFKNYEKK